MKGERRKTHTPRHEVKMTAPEVDAGAAVLGKASSSVAALADVPCADAPCSRTGDRNVSETLRCALMDSRQLWRDLVMLTCDIAFETDADGCFSFVAPEKVFGWPAERLIGQAAAQLLAARECAVFDPFFPSEPIRNSKTWIRHADGRTVCLAFHVAPVFDAQGRRVGARGVGQDVTDQEYRDARVATTLRRGEILDFILTRIRKEVMAPRMMQAALDALVAGLGAEGAAVIGIADADGAPAVLHRVGSDPAGLVAEVVDLVRDGSDFGRDRQAVDGRPLLAVSCPTRFGERAALVLWRDEPRRGWHDDDRALIRSASTVVRFLLENDAIQREMAWQARTDPLTSLLNRRALLDEMARRVDRLDREGVPGTLMFIDLDGFKVLNDSRGHEVGDEALCIVAHLLRTAFRPADLVARLGGDEFAIWMDGCDELAAAERAETLSRETPIALGHLMEPSGVRLGMSIGIATRWPGRTESLEQLMHRADQIMYEVKRTGRGHWRVSRVAGG